MHGSLSISLYIVCVQLILYSTETFGLFRPGYRLTLSAFRNISGLGIVGCKFECLSRIKCRSFNYYRHVKLCCLLELDSSSREMVRDPKVTYEEKQTWSEQSVAFTCDSSCSHTQTCRLQGNTTYCRIEECGSLDDTSDLVNLRGNMRNTGSKIFYELPCYDILSDETKNLPVFSICKEDGEWLTPNITCYKDITDFVNHEGCFQDRSDRVLSGSELRSDDMTISLCARYCSEKGFTYFGVQFARECFCGSTFTSIGTSDACDDPCAGDPTTLCGGSWALNVYTYKPVMHAVYDST